MDKPNVAVAGQVMTKTLAEYERRALIFLQVEQEKLLPNNCLIDFLCESVRLKREYHNCFAFCRQQQSPRKKIEDTK
jgi:hypothetical protein